ncbi:hypothetical protein BH10BAC2_BH10BAC2_30250 [soil metagenome]
MRTFFLLISLLVIQIFVSAQTNMPNIITVAAENEEGNKDWNGVWDAKTSITNEGWFAEIRIPFNSLQFKKILCITKPSILKEISGQKNNRYCGQAGQGIVPFFVL